MRRLRRRELVWRQKKIKMVETKKNTGKVRTLRDEGKGEEDEGGQSRGDWCRYHGQPDLSHCPLGCISAHVLDWGEQRKEQCTFPSRFTLVLLLYFSFLFLLLIKRKHSTHWRSGSWKKNQFNLPKKVGRDVPHTQRPPLCLEYTFSDKGPWSVTEALAINHAGATTFSLKGPERTNEGDGAHPCMAFSSGSLCDNTRLLWSRSSRRTQALCLRSCGLILPGHFSLTPLNACMYLKQGRNILGQFGDTGDIHGLYAASQRV